MCGDSALKPKLIPYELMARVAALETLKAFGPRSATSNNIQRSAMKNLIRSCRSAANYQAFRSITTTLGPPTTRKTVFLQSGRACSSHHNQPNFTSPASKMAEIGAWGAWQVEPAGFTKHVVNSMKKLYAAFHPSIKFASDSIFRYPEELADRSWDNVGLLLGNSETDAKKRKPMVMVVNDLTFQVAVDAIGQGVSVIVSYRVCSSFAYLWPR